MAVAHHCATVISDLLFLLRRHSLNLFCREAEDFEALCSCGANGFAMLSDASGKNQKVDASQQSNVGADCFAYCSGENVQRKSGMGIVREGSLFKCLHVALAG